jgi:hypothetical protein
MAGAQAEGRQSARAGKVPAWHDLDMADDDFDKHGAEALMRAGTEIGH